jgi:hypothetical protein
MKPFVFITDCVSAKGSDIQDMVDRAREITYRTISTYCELSDVFGHPSPSLKKDWAVRFFKSKYQGLPCYYVCHSAIEYVFIPA